MERIKGFSITKSFDPALLFELSKNFSSKPSGTTLTFLLSFGKKCSSLALEKAESVMMTSLFFIAKRFKNVKILLPVLPGVADGYSRGVRS